MSLVLFRNTCLLAVLLLNAFFTQAQNLVKNASFEMFVNCPKKLGNLTEDVSFWSAPTNGSTDYFNGCSIAMGTPKNFNGTQSADFGKGYAGLYLYAPDDYREYLQAELTSTLVKGKKYKVSFYVSLAERSDYAIKEFGLLFSKHKLHIPTKKVLSKRLIYQEREYDYNFLEIGYTNFYSDTKDWISVHSKFVAKGTEKYMILGNFKNNARTRFYKTKKKAKQGAYYYIDLVVVNGIEDVITKTYELNTVHTFNNLLFDFDRYLVLLKAKNEIAILVAYLQRNTSLAITINGYTDNIGSVAYNQKLSSKRAKAVAEELQKAGISKKRIIWKGYGGIKPIADNGTAIGRQQNRRVVFVIAKGEK